jgi:hypothetical protein
MSKCPTKQQDAVIDFLSEKVIEKIPCQQDGGKKRRVKRNGSKKQKGGVTRVQVRNFLKRVMNIGIACLVIYCMVTGPWENLVRELNEGYELWASGGCRSMGQRFFNAFSAGNRFCAVATGLERDAWGFLMNDPTGRSTLFQIVSSVMGIAGAYASYNAVADRIADGVASVVGSRPPDIPAIESGMDPATRQQIEALTTALQQQISAGVDRAVDAAVDRILADERMYARIAEAIQPAAAARRGPRLGSSYTVPRRDEMDDDDGSQETIGSDPNDMMYGGKRRKTIKKKRKNKTSKRAGKSRRRNRK